MPRIISRKTTRVRMLSSLVVRTKIGPEDHEVRMDAYEAGGVYDAPADKAESWLAYGCAELVDADTPLRSGWGEEEAQEAFTTIHPSEIHPVAV
jgi:hypothetical protein